MGVYFTGTVGHYLQNASPPLPVMPFTLMCWIRFRVLPSGNIVAFGYSNNTLTNAAGSWFRIRCSGTTGIPAADSGSAGAGVQALPATGPTANIWFFVVARFISSTNRRTAALFHTGTSHGVNTTSSVPVGINDLTFGAIKTTTQTGTFTGEVAECSVIGADVQPGGLQLDDNLLRQLAYGGPFSVPNIADKVMFYRSFRSALPSKEDRPDEHDVSGSNSRQTITQVGTPILCSHPPLPPGYERPVDIIRPVMMV